MRTFKIKAPICKSSVFCEASPEELKVLIAVLEHGGAPLDDKRISELAEISAPRAKSALAFWREAGIMEECEITDGNITEEFASRSLDASTLELSGTECARLIRDNALAETIDECARLLNKTALPPEDVKKIVALHTEYGFDTDFIITLLAYVVSNSSAPNATMLVRRAKALYDKSINTVEKLEAYIKDTEEQVAGEMELRRMMGIYRPLTKTQREYASRWMGELCFGLDIIGEAYDITVNSIDKVSFKYMDKILTSWHEAGCISAADCKRKSEADRLQKSAAQGKKPQQKKKAEDKPRYGNFDADEVFKRALERSYGSDADKK